MIYVNEAGRLSRHNSFMDSSLVAAFSRKVPRYTSYPTAAQFSEAVGSVCHATWLQRLPRAALVSLYLHIPYCRQLCWYCGCHMRVARGDAPLARYSDALLAEIGTIGRTMGFRPWVERIHWGGGTPTTLRPEDFLRIHEAVKTTFEVRPGAEIAVEIDPRNLGDSMVETLAATGTTRVSFGVQDFDEDVQAAINRRQSFALTRDAVERVRRAGIGSVNIDLVYGLPRQTRESVARTIGQTLALEPDRIALFGYAHVPWLKRHQALIAEADLPGPEARWEQAQTAAALLTGAGYVPIGIDHFARPDDRLAQAAAAGRLRRNFQGYTDDDSDALIGIGASAISATPDGYTQNAADIRIWTARVMTRGLATARGIALNDEDRLRRDIIERLMCDMRVDLAAFRQQPGSAPVITQAGPALEVLARGGLVTLDGPIIEIRPEARQLARVVAATFDGYLGGAAERHSLAV